MLLSCVVIRLLRPGILSGTCAASGSQLRLVNVATLASQQNLLENQLSHTPVLSWRQCFLPIAALPKCLCI